MRSGQTCILLLGKWRGRQCGGLVWLWLSVPMLSRVRRRAEIFLEESERAAPGEVGSFLVVARSRRVVVKGVVGTFIHILGEFLIVRLQCLFPGWNALVQSSVVACVMRKDRRLNVLHLALVGGERPVIRHRGVQIGTVHGHQVDHAAPEAKADDANLAIRLCMVLEKG